MQTDDQTAMHLIHAMIDRWVDASTIAYCILYTVLYCIHNVYFIYRWVDASMRYRLSTILVLERGHWATPPTKEFQT